MKRIVISILSLLALTLGVNAESINYSYYHGTESLGNWGAGKAETYNVAMRVDDASLVGKTIKSVTIPVVTDAKSTSGYVAFLSHELKVSGGKAVADITSVEFTPDGEWTKVTFTEPYVVEDGGFYVGYTFKVDAVNDDYDKNPVRLMVSDTPGALYVATSRTYRKWTDLVETLGANTPLQLEVEGDFAESSCGVASLPDVRVKVGESTTVEVTIANHGASAINDISYQYKIGDEIVEHQIALPTPLTADFYGNTTTVTVETPVISALGTYSGLLTITKVNGVDNPDPVASVASQVDVMNVVPVKRSLMEEYTGTWCGYCPRGWVAMRVLNEKYPDRFIAASYHNADAMQIHSGSSDDPYPANIAGLPCAFLDRVLDVDPYFGDGNKPMGIEKTWKDRCADYTPANISVEATLAENNSVISANTTVTFVADMDNQTYRVGYIVTADGLSGTTSNWLQHSYFPGATGYGPEMDQFTQGPEYQYLVFDDVVIANSEYSGIYGSLPSTVKEAEDLHHSYEFALKDMVSNYGDKEYLVQDENKLNVIAVVVDYMTGEIVNAAKCRVQNPTGINAVADADKKVASVEYFDLSGRKISVAPASGLYLKSVKYSDGTTSVRKIRK